MKYLCYLAVSTACFAKGPFTLALTSVVVSVKSFLCVFFILPSTALHSNTGHGHIHSSKHHAIFECGAVGRSKKSVQ